MSQEEAFDRPVEFGSKQAWIAARTSNGRALADALRLSNEKPSTWIVGIDHAHFGDTPGEPSEMFVTPCVAGWTLAVGGLRGLTERPSAQWLSYLCELSAELGEINYFNTYRIVGHCAWAKIQQGHIVRAFSYLGERGETLVDIGTPTSEEFDINLRSPRERDLMKLAGRWSVNPSRINDYEHNNQMGLLGSFSVPLY